VPNCLDDNYLFLNPRWRWQSPIPGPTPVPIDVDHPATAQFTEIDNPSLLKSTGFVLLAPITSLFGGVVCSVTRGHRKLVRRELHRSRDLGHA